MLKKENAAYNADLVERVAFVQGFQAKHGDLYELLNGEKILDYDGGDEQKQKDFFKIIAYAYDAPFLLIDSQADVDVAFE